MTENKPTIDASDEIEFDEVLVKELMELNITPAEFFPSATMKINMSWTQLIALINKKANNLDKILSTSVPAKRIMELYSKLMSKSFL